MENLRLRFDFNNMMSDFIGDRGIKESDIEKLMPRIESAHRAMAEKRLSGGMDWRDLPYNQSRTVDEIIDYVNEVKDDFEAFVVLGIGGSALGPMAVQQAIKSPYYNELDREKRGGFPKLYVMDNVDPERLAPNRVPS